MKRAAIQWHSPEAEAALRFFLSHVALPDKRARYLDLIGRPTSRRKFLHTVYHELESHLNPAKRIVALSPTMLHLPGFWFKPGAAFGKPVNALGDVVSSQEESFLAISTDGRVGIHGPESIGGRGFYVVKTISDFNTP